jgi:hypothetical protein
MCEYEKSHFGVYFIFQEGCIPQIEFEFFESGGNNPHY